MNDPFQAKKQARPQASVLGKPMLRDTTVTHSETVGYPAGLLRPRNRRAIRAVKLLDTLTAGDEGLYEYLKVNQPKAARAVENAKIDMAAATTPEEAEAFRPDSIDALLAGPVPGPNEVDFQALKASLLAECQNAIALAALPKAEEPIPPPTPNMYLADCGIPGCCIHSVAPQQGIILHHYSEAEATTKILRHARGLLSKDKTIVYIEVHDSVLCAVCMDGSVTPHTL